GRERGVRVGVGAEDGREEERLAHYEQPPREARSRPLDRDPEGDRGDSGEAEAVDERAAALQARDEEVRGRERPGDREVPDPDRRPPAAAKPLHRQAACSRLLFAGCRSKPFASFPSTSTSCSISAFVLAAVTWIRKPTSLRGTSGYAARVT